MVEKDKPKLSIGKQCKLLSISRSSFYYQPKGETALNLMLMRKISNAGGGKTMCFGLLPLLSANSAGPASQFIIGL